MEREKAFEILKQKIKNQNLVKHCLAVEAVMRALARYFNKDENKWALTGLLHDIDYEATKDSPKTHSLVGAEMLKELGIDQDICQAVKVHNEIHDIPAQTLMEKALFCSDPITGLIVAATLVLPSKKLADLTNENVLNRFKEKGFARGANREIIAKCEELLSLGFGEFSKIALEAMQSIAVELGL